MPRVTPRLPAQLGPAQAQALIQGPHNFAIPNIPMMFGLHNAILAHLTATPGATAENILTHFGIDTDSAGNILINGLTFPPAFNNVGVVNPPSARQYWSVTCPGIGQPLELTEELLANFKLNRRQLILPVIQGASSTRTLAEFTRINTGKWFSTLKRNMSVYCRFVKGSGTMQDLKTEGPAAGQIISQITTIGVAQPTGFFRQDRLVPGDASYTTTMPANDRMAELVSAYSQINARFSSHPNDWHSQVGEEDENNGRHGDFWSIRPVRPPTAPDHFKDSLAAEVSRYVRERADKD